MAEYETEEERIEAIRTWWKENGRSIVFGAVLGIGLLLGWRGWIAYQDNQGRAASTLYAQLLQDAAVHDGGRVAELARRLREEYGSTPYAALAALEVAALKSEAELDQSAGELSWVMEHGDEAILQDLARLRLARVRIAQGRAEEALKLLDRDWGLAYAGLVEEARGDAWRAKGDEARARQAYTKALLSGPADPAFLRMKLDELGEAPRPAEAAAG